MAVDLPQHPFSADQPDVRLARAPLARALVQLRFPPATSIIADPQAYLKVAASLAAAYPTYEETVEATLQLSAQPTLQFTQVPQAKVAILRNPSRGMSVTISPTAIAWDTRAYTSRSDMLVALREVFDAALPVVRPASIERIGVRYSNVLSRDEGLSERVNASLLSGLTAGEGAARVVQGVSEIVYRLERSELGVRLALLPPNVSFDPGVVVPSEGPGSFLLDLDSYRQGSASVVDSSALLDEVEKLAAVASGYFLWSLTPAGADFYGAEDA